MFTFGDSHTHPRHAFIFTSPRHLAQCNKVDHTCLVSIPLEALSLKKVIT